MTPHDTHTNRGARRVTAIDTFADDRTSGGRPGVTAIDTSDEPA
jgi:hypothetical protein